MTRRSSVARRSAPEARFAAAGFRIREWTNYTDEVIAWLEQFGKPDTKLTTRLVFGDDGEGPVTVLDEFVHRP